MWAKMDDHEEDLETLGEQLYTLIYSKHKEDAGKLTGETWDSQIGWSGGFMDILLLFKSFHVFLLHDSKYEIRMSCHWVTWQEGCWKNEYISLKTLILNRRMTKIQFYLY